MNNINEKQDSLCTGCGACYAVCPHSAISYEIGPKGFFIAHAEEDRCTHCGLCTKSCIKFSFHRDDCADLFQKSLYAAQSSNPQDLESCTSGGVAQAFSKMAVSQQRTVLGTVYDSDRQIAKTVFADTQQELEPLKGSKYLQSETAHAYRELIKDMRIHLHKQYLVFGTPCQIYGLSGILSHLGLRERAVLVDLCCHGIPSYLVWNNYLEHLKNKKGMSKIDQVVFRDKVYGWHNYTMHIRGNGKEFYECSENSLLYQAFFDNVFLNTPCLKCELRRKYSRADIRLGDFWGKDYIQRDDGVTAVFVLTQRGKEFWDSAKENLHILDQHQPEDCLAYQSLHIYNISEQLQTESIEALSKNHNLKKTMRIYRRSFPFRYHVKLAVKRASAGIPMSLRIRLKKSYQKRTSSERE